HDLITWYNGYTDSLIMPTNTVMNTVIIYGLDHIVRSFMEADQPRDAFNQWLTYWLQWEQQDASSYLYVIGSDVGKGIVPIDEDERHFRDLVGWCFQDVAKKADRMDIVWYGLHKQLK